jgi:hypothetical protein
VCVRESLNVDRPRCVFVCVSRNAPFQRLPWTWFLVQGVGGNAATVRATRTPRCRLGSLGGRTWAAVTTAIAKKGDLSSRDDVVRPCCFFLFRFLHVYIKFGVEFGVKTNDVTKANGEVPHNANSSGRSCQCVFAEPALAVVRQLAAERVSSRCVATPKRRRRVWQPDPHPSGPDSTPSRRRNGVHGRGWPAHYLRRS